MKPIWARLQQTWATVLELPTNQKTVLIGAVLFGLLGLIFIMQHVFAGPAYEPVFNQLSPSDASAITALLSTAKIPYVLQDGGATIAVPDTQAATARLQVAGQGLPKEGVQGYELFDTSQFGMNDFQQQVEYTQALEGELDRVIDQMQQVSEARVEIVLPKESVFVTESQPSTAAVFLKLKPYANLAPDDVRGIVKLVASSVQGLQAKNVTVVDDRGEVLSTDLSTNTEAMTASSDLSAQRTFESDLQQKLQDVLEPVLGPGNVVTRVSADLNFDRVHRTEKLFTAPVNNHGLVQSLQSLQETFSGSGSTASIPGVGSNIPNYAIGTTGGPSSYSHQETTVNNIYNEATQETTVAPGAVQRLSVAVVVNRQLSASAARTLTSVVSAAIGADAARHDQITVTGLPFNTSLADTFRKQMAAEASAQRLQGLAVPGAIVVAAGLLAWAAMRALRQRSRRQEDLAQMEALSRAKAQMVGPPTEEAGSERELARLVQGQPDGVAEILRVWLRED